MPVNSVQQKNLVEIIQNGCIRSGINLARRAAVNIVQDLKSKNDAAAVKIGPKYDRRTAAVDKKMKAICEKADAEEQELEDELTKIRLKIHDKQCAISEKKKADVNKLKAEKDAIIEEARTKDHIRIGTGNRTYNHIRHLHVEEPGTWVICDDHPKASELTKESAKLNNEIRDMEVEAELIQQDLWLVEETADAKTCIGRLKGIRKRYNAIIEKDPETATL